MKLAKLSLAAMVVAGLASSSFAADTLADAFKNGKVSGELRAWYFDREGSPTASETAAASTRINADIFNVGVILGYVTDSFYGFKLGATVQSNYAPFADSDAKTDFNTDEYGSGAVLSEAYIQYSIGNTTATIGRQFISTPLVNGSGSRMIKQAFEGAVLLNTDLPQTTLAAGVVTKYQARTSLSLTGTQGVTKGSDVADFTSLESLVDAYAYTLLAINKSIPGTTLTAQWAGLDNYADFYYLEAAYAGKAGEISYGLAANYELKSPDNFALFGTNEDGKMYGAKVDLGYGDLKTYVAYTKITDDADVNGFDGAAGFGGGAQTAFAKAYSSRVGTYDRDSKAYSVDANYNFKAIGLLAGARYTDVSVDNAAAKAAKTEDRGYTDVYMQYAFSGALKGFSTDVSYQDWSKDVDGHDFWFKANYKF